MRRRFTRKNPKIKRITYGRYGMRTEYFRLVTNLQSESVKTEDEKIQPEPVFETKENTDNESPSLYSDKRKKLAESWKQIRSCLLSTRTEEMAPATFNCTRCNEFSEEIIHCTDCSSIAYYCKECCDDIHRTVLFHSPSVWKKIMYVPYTNNRKMELIRPDHIGCGTSYSREICIVDMKGLQHKSSVHFCKCEPEAVTALRYGMWPGTPEKPHVFFQLELMELCAVLQIESHLSVKSFCDALSLIRRYKIHPVQEVKDIYRVLVGDCSNEYRFHHTTFDCGKYLGVDSHKCPACNEDLSQRIISVDGNFGLVHKKSSGVGQGLTNVRHEKNIFFLNQQEIDSFVEESTPPKINQDCSSFQAGSAIRSKVKNAKLDVTGVFGSVCKHDMPLKFCNLRQGERLAYAVHFMNSFRAENSGSTIFMYDIACLLHKHLTKINNQELLSQFQCVVPVFHSFAHNMQCQLQYGQRNADNTGMADGEGTERLWSYLRPFAKMTKEMSLDNRHDLLVDALYHYSRKLKNKLAERIVSKHKKAVTQKESSLKLIQKFEKDTGTSMEKLAKLYDERKRRATIPNFEGSTDISSKEEYCWHVNETINIRRQIATANNEDQKNQLQNDLDRTEKKLAQLEKRHNINRKVFKQSLVTSYKEKKEKLLKKAMKDLSIQRNYLLMSMKKYADGQDVAVRIGKQLKTVNDKLASYLKDFNAISNNGIKFSEVTSHTAKFYSNIDIHTFSVQQTDGITVYTDYLRASEEVVASTSEMQNLVKWLDNSEKEIKAQIRKLENSESSRLNTGSQVLLLLMKMENENMRKRLHTLISEYVEYNVGPTSVIDYVIQEMNITKFDSTISSTELLDTLEVIAAYEDFEDRTEDVNDIDNLSDED